MKASVTGLPRELAPLLSVPGVGGLVAGGGLTPPPKQGRSPFCTQLSCPLTSPHRDPEWPLYEQHN